MYKYNKTIIYDKKQLKTSIILDEVKLKLKSTE